MAKADIILFELQKYIRNQLARKWAEKGHKLTNKLINDLDVLIKKQVNFISIETWFYEYGEYMERGVKAKDIPYTQRPRGQGTKGKSLYIEGLMNYIEKKMNIAKGTQQNKSIAFIIANKHKKFGMPLRTKGSGTGWMTLMLKESEPHIETQISRFAETEITVIIDNMIRKTQTLLKA